MKYQAPEGCTGISVGGEQFNVDENGQIEVPETGDYHSLLAPHGFTPVRAPKNPAAPKGDAGANTEGDATQAAAAEDETKAEAAPPEAAPEAAKRKAK